MTGTTALREAYKKAGGNPHFSLAHQVAVECLRKADLSVAKAIGPFVAQLREAGGIMAEVVSYEATRAAALIYLERISADMRGPKVAGASIRAHDVIQAVASQQPQFRREAVEGSELEVAKHPTIGSSENCEDGESGAVLDRQRYTGSPSSQTQGNDAAHEIGDILAVSGRVVASPRPQNEPRGLQSLQNMRKVAGPSLFETYMVRSRPVGELMFGELDTMIATTKREAALLTLIRNHAHVPLPTMRVKDVIKLVDLQLMIQKAAEMADAA